MIGRGVAYRKTEETDLCWSARSKRGSCSSGGVWRTAKRDFTGYCSSIIYCLSPASTCDCSSTGSCSSSLHRLLFNQPSPRGPVQAPLHGLLFIQPSTGSCSSTGSIDQSTVHPAATASTTTGSCSSNPPPGTVHPNPLNNAHYSTEAASIGFS